MLFSWSYLRHEVSVFKNQVELVDFGLVCHAVNSSHILDINEVVILIKLRTQQLKNVELCIVAFR